MQKRNGGPGGVEWKGGVDVLADAEADVLADAEAADAPVGWIESI